MLAVMKRLASRTHRLSEEFHERRLGIATTEWHQVHDPARPEWRGYGPTDYQHWNRIRPYIDARADASFVDYGAGLGRVTILAARLQFGRVVGVELDDALVARGNENIKNARGLKCQAHIVCADANSFAFPDDASAAFFCNPFSGSVLAAALGNIKTSLSRRSRPVQFICNLPEASGFEHEIKMVEWLTLDTNLPLSNQRTCLIFRPRFC